MNAASDVLQLPLAKIGEFYRQLLSNLFIGGSRNADASGLTDCLQASGHVHAVAENVITVDQNVAKIDPDAENDTAINRYGGIAGEHATLYHNGAGHRVHDTSELYEEAITSGLHDATSMTVDRRIN